MQNTTYRKAKYEPQTYVPWVCEEHERTVQHEKLMPVCKNVTRQNCITIWKTDTNGNPVSANIREFPNTAPKYIFISE